MKKLPQWVLPDNQPAFYDCESSTAIEMVAKLYGAMTSLIDDYNVSIQQLNDEIKSVETEITESNECYKEKLIEMMNDFIDAMNMVNDRHTKEINEAVYYMKEGLTEKIETVVGEMVQNGELDETIVTAIQGFETQLTTLSERINYLEQFEHLKVTYDSLNESITIE